MTPLTYGQWAGRAHFVEVAFASGNNRWVSYRRWAASLRFYAVLQLEYLVKVRRAWLAAGAPLDFTE